MGTALQKLLASRGIGNSKETTKPNSNLASSKKADGSDSSDSSIFGGYFKKKETELDNNSSASAFDKILNQRNEEEKSESTIHGMTDKEYEEYCEHMYNEYGIVLEQAYNYGHFKSVAYSMSLSCSQDTRFRAQEKIAQSYNDAGVLGLVIDAKLDMYIQEKFGGKVPGWKSLLKAGRPGGTLYEKYGICVTESAGLYSFSLVDEKGNIIENEDGNLAQVYKSDYLMPDGLAQKNEIHCAEALDAMGFDIKSALDLSSEEYAMVRAMAEQNDNSKLGKSSNIKGTDGGAIKDRVLGTFDKSTKKWSKVQSQDNSAWTSESYVDKVTGQTTGVKTRGREFNSTNYRGKKGFVGENPTVGTVSEDVKYGFEGSTHGGSSSGSTDSTDTNNIETTNNNDNKEVVTKNNKAKNVRQRTFNQKVELYFAKGFDFKKAVQLANRALNTDFKYTGSDISKEQREAA